MALAVDATSTSNTDPLSATQSWSHTCTGSERLLYVIVTNWANADGDKCTGVTYNSVALTNVADSGRGPGGDYVQVWRLIAPATGANTVTVTFGSSSGNHAGPVGAISLTGGDQTTPEGTPATATGNSATASATVSSAVGEIIVGGMATDETTAAEQAPVVTFYESDDDGEFGAGGSASGAASVDFKWTLTSNTWAVAAIPAKPTGAAPTTTPGFMTTLSNYWGP